MPSELVRYDGHVPSFTGTVADFAVVLDPLLGLSGLVAKVMAARVEVERLNVDVGRDRQIVPQRRRGSPDLSRLEQNFDAALAAIKVEGTARRQEADRRFVVEMRRIDSALRVEMGRLAEERRRNQQSFMAARQRLRVAEAARRDIGKAMGEASRMMRSRSRYTEIAALTVPILSQAMTAVVTRHQDGTAAVLEALSRPAQGRLETGRLSQGRLESGRRAEGRTQA